MSKYTFTETLGEIDGIAVKVSTEHGEAEITFEGGFVILTENYEQFVKELKELTDKYRI